LTSVRAFDYIERMGDMNSGEKAERLKLATKRAYRAARRAGKPVGWSEARERGLGWCTAMWPWHFMTKGRVQS
jgi:hypothetical protein